MNHHNLYLVGTIHYDIDGKDRLETLLNKISPTTIALEFSKDREYDQPTRESSHDDVQRGINKLVDKSGLDLNLKQKKTLIKFGQKYRNLFGYEYICSKEYTQRDPNSKLEYIDINILEEGKEKFIKGRFELIKRSFDQIAKFPQIANAYIKALDEGIEPYKEFQRKNIHQSYQNINLLKEFFEFLRDPYVFEAIKKTRSAEEIIVLEILINPQRDEVMSRRIRELYDEDSKLVAVVGLAHLPGIMTKIEDLNPKVITLAEYDSIQ